MFDMTVDQPPTDEALAAGQAIRKQRLTFAFVTVAGSKFLAILVQWLALPLALRALGMERYAAFLSLQAFTAWSGLLALGLAPSLPRFIAVAHVSGDHAGERNIFLAAFGWVTVAACLFGGFMLALGALISPEHLAATHSDPQEIWMAYIAIVAIASLQLITGIMPAIRSGYQEVYYSYVWACAANIIVMAGLFFMGTGHPKIWMFILILYLPQALLMIADLSLLCFQRPYLVRGERRLLETTRSLAAQTGNALAGQVAYFLVSFLPTLLLAHISSAPATAAFGSIMQMIVLANSGLQIVFQPLVPAIANAYAQHDRRWVRKAYLRALALVLSICGGGLFTDILFGQTLLHAWLGARLEIPRLLPIFLGLYFCISAVNMMHFLILAATGNLQGVGRSYLIEGTLAVAIGTSLVGHFGSTGMAAGLVIATACVNLWYLSLCVSRRVIVLP